MPKNVTIVSRIKRIVRALGPAGPGSTPLTEVQAEDPDSEVFGSVSGQRLSQAIIAWGATITSIFKGVLNGNTEAAKTLTIVSGAVSEEWASIPNVLNLPSLTQNTVFTLTGDLIIDKYVTLKTIPDTGGPWTLSIAYGAKTIPLTRNGSGTADEELFELWADGTDIIAPDAGGLTASKGT